MSKEKVLTVVLTAVVAGCVRGFISSWFWPTMETLGPWEISPGFLQTVYFTVAIAMALTVICLNWEWLERWLHAKRRAEDYTLQGSLTRTPLRNQCCRPAVPSLATLTLRFPRSLLVRALGRDPQLQPMP